MRFVLVRVSFAALALVFGLRWFSPFTQPAYADGPCTTRGDNLTRNGSVTDGGYDTPHGVVANSWNAFLMSGDWPAFDLADNESANGDIGGSSSQYIHGDGVTFDSGIYQVISGTQPGASYDFSVGWAAMLRDTGGGHNTKVDDAVIRRVGYDPTGGTDPQSANVQWGPEVGTGSSGRSLNNPDMRITFKALSNQVTVFARVYNHGSSASDKVFFDVMCLLPRGDIPVEQIAPTVSPTLPATDIPPTPRFTSTPRPTRVPPTETPIPATPLPAQVMTATPAKVAEGRATETPAARPFIPGITGGANDSSGGNGLNIVVILGGIGIIGISLLGIVGIGGFILWRMFNRQVDDALDPAFYPDDQQPYQ